MTADTRESKKSLQIALVLLEHLKRSAPPSIRYVVDKRFRSYVDRIWKYGKRLVYLAEPEFAAFVDLVYYIVRASGELYDASLALLRGEPVELYHTSGTLYKLKKALATA